MGSSRYKESHVSSTCNCMANVCLMLYLSADLLAQLGESKSEQRQNAQEKLARKRQLIAERQANGLSTDDAVIEAIVEEEIQKAPKKKRVCVS